jgi:hypothetical protein
MDNEFWEVVAEELKSLLQGDFSSHKDFPYFYTKYSYPIASPLDGLPILPQTIPEVLLKWAQMDSESQWNPEDFLFLDLETTGLGRNQTFAFLIGLGYYEKDQLVVEQIFLPVPEAEVNSFDRLAELLSRKAVLITFNGKTFDIPILESRLLYNRIWLNLREKEHIDLLQLARRLWKNKLPSCALETLEFYLMGKIREEEWDIDSELIPQTYFQYLQTGEPEALKKVFIHNQLDILHTAALFTLICDSIDYPPVAGYDQRIDYYALAQLYLRQGDKDKAKCILSDLLNQNYLNGDVACALGILCKQEGNIIEAERYFAIATDLFHPDGMLEYAKLLERRKAYTQALEVALKLLHWNLSRPLVNSKRILELEKRVKRLQQKIGD